MSSSPTQGKLPVVFGSAFVEPKDIMGDATIDHEEGVITIRLTESQKIFTTILAGNMEIMFLSFGIKVTPSNKETQ